MLKRNIVANYVGTAWNAVMSIAFVPVYVKYLGTEAYGVIGISAVISSFLSFFDLGLSPMLSREMARYRGGAHAAESIRSLLRVVEMCSWTVGLLGMVVLWFAAPWLAFGWLRSESLSPETIAHALRIMAAVIGLRFVEGMYRGVLNGLQRQVTVNAISSSAATLRGLGSIAVLAWWSPTLDAFFWWQGAVAVLSIVLFVIFGYTALPRALVTVQHGIRTLRVTWPFAGGMLISSFLALGYGQVDKLLLSRLLELSEYGEYMLAVTMSSCVMMATSPIGQAAYPKFTELLASGDRLTLANVFHRTAQLVTLVAGSGCIVLIFFAEQIIALWTGDPELAARTAPTVRNLTAGNGINATMVLPYLLLLATGRTTFINLYSALSVAFVVPALLLTVPSSGMVGAATVWLALNTILFFVVAPISIAYVLPGQAFHWYWRDLAIPVLAMISACAIMKAISGSIAMGTGLALCYTGLAAIATASAGCLAIPMARRNLWDLQIRISREVVTLVTHRAERR